MDAVLRAAGGGGSKHLNSSKESTESTLGGKPRVERVVVEVLTVRHLLGYSLQADPHQGFHPQEVALRWQSGQEANRPQARPTESSKGRKG